MTPDNSHHDDPSPSPDGGMTPDHFDADGPARIERITRKTSAGHPRFSLEMFESPLMDSGIAYTVHDCPPAEAGASERSWIDFIRPTAMYRDTSGDHKVLVRLTVDGGRLSITSPDCYRRGSLVRTTDPPIDHEGTLRIARLGAGGEPQIDLLMAADGLVTAMLRLETIPRPITRRDIVSISDLFVTGVDLLDLVVRRHRLLIQKPDSPDG